MTLDAKAFYRASLEAKAALAAPSGIEVSPDEVHPALKDHQQAMVVGAVRGGRRAIFAAFSLGYTLIQLEDFRDGAQYVGEAAQSADVHHAVRPHRGECMKPERPSPKAEALKALAQLQTILGADLDPLQRVMARGLVTYAVEQVEAMQEVKRRRRAERDHGQG